MLSRPSPWADAAGLLLFDAPHPGRPGDTRGLGSANSFLTDIDFHNTKDVGAASAGVHHRAQSRPQLRRREPPTSRALASAAIFMIADAHADNRDIHAWWARAGIDAGRSAMNRCCCRGPSALGLCDPRTFRRRTPRRPRRLGVEVEVEQDIDVSVWSRRAAPEGDFSGSADHRAIATQLGIERNATGTHRATSRMKTLFCTP